MKILAGPAIALALLLSVPSQVHAGRHNQSTHTTPKGYHHDGTYHWEGPELLLLLGIILVVLIVVAIRAATMEFAVNTRNGVPYCRNCGRQVSYRRNECRSCGQSLYVARPPAVSTESERLREAEYDRLAKAAELAERRAHEARKGRQEAERVAKREARDAYYRDRGVEPGPWAWYKVLPEVTQVVLLGLACGSPAVVVAIVVVSWQAAHRAPAPVAQAAAASAATQSVAVAP